MSSLTPAVGPQRTFPTHPRLDRYFASASAEAARARLRECLAQGDGPAVLVGAAGVGKTMLVEVLAAELAETHRVVRLASSQVCTRRALLQSVLHGLELPYRDHNEGELRLGLAEAIESADRPIALLVDEAQSLSPRLLEELRQLSDVATGGQPCVRLLLAGTSALDELFTAPELDAFNQRLAARCYLEPLSRDETAQYVRGHLAADGLDPDGVLAAEAYESLSLATDGVPRLVNQLAEQAIRVAQHRGSLVDKATVGEAWSELHQLSAPWHTPAVSDLAIEPEDADVVRKASITDVEKPTGRESFDAAPSLDAAPCCSGGCTNRTSEEPAAAEVESAGIGAIVGRGDACVVAEPAVHSADPIATDAATDLPDAIPTGPISQGGWTVQGGWNADQQLDAILSTTGDQSPIDAAVEPALEDAGDTDDNDGFIALAFPQPQRFDASPAFDSAPEDVADAIDDRLTADPFAEDFDEEEVLLDPQAQLERVIPAAPTVVATCEPELAQGLAQLTGEPAPATPRVESFDQPTREPAADAGTDRSLEGLGFAAVAVDSPGSDPLVAEPGIDAAEAVDDDAILIVERDEPTAAGADATPEAERREYAQLFASLRQG